MQKTILLLFLFLIVPIANTQESILSEQAEISVLTIGQGTSLNDAFGHSGFRIKDVSKGVDLVFNYGVFDFGAPNFYLKFAQGKLNYSIGLDYFEDFYKRYVTENRTVKEQVLNLSAVEKQALFDYLIVNIRPENREYLYDFFYDNCATKMKDVTNISVDNNIAFNKPKDFQNQTFRALIYNNVTKNSWGSFGIDIALGSVIDRTARPVDHMFLPENIYKFFEVATVKNTNKPLVKSSEMLYRKIDRPVSSSFFTSPLFVLGILGLIILFITYKDYKAKKQTVWLDVTIFSITGFVGIVILWLWFATDHKATHQNYNLLWAFALNIFMISQFLKPKIKKWFIKYLKLLVILLCLLALHWFMGVQVFALGLIPLLVALFIRYIYLIKFLNVQNNLK